MAELREPLELATWRHPAGTLRAWVRWSLVLACLATIALPFAGARSLWLQGAWGTHIPKIVFQNMLTVIAITCVIAIAVPRFRLSRYVRIAVLVPIAHLVLVVIAWPVWLAIAPKIELIGHWYDLARHLPLSALVGGEVVLVVGAASAIARRRRDAGWSHAFVMIALLDLLLLGLWLPIITWLSCHGSWVKENEPQLAMMHVARLTTIVLVPPLVTAIAYTALAIRAPAITRTFRVHAIGAIAGLLVIALALRANASAAACIVYANYIHALIGALVVATAGPLVLAGAMWSRARTQRRLLARDAGAISGVLAASEPDTGRAAEPGEPLACFEIAGWLRPPRSLVHSFVITTATGAILVDGARLVASLDPATTVLRDGEAFAALRVGDRVTITSAAALNRDLDDRADPFRTTAAPRIGSDPMIAPYGVPPLTFSDLALALWRPSVAYLVILVAIAGPALAALAASVE